MKGVHAAAVEQPLGGESALDDSGASFDSHSSTQFMVLPKEPDCSTQSYSSPSLLKFKCNSSKSCTERPNFLKISLSILLQLTYKTDLKPTNTNLLLDR